MCTIGEAMTDYYIFCGSHNWISPVAVLDASDIYIPMDLSKSNLSSAVHLHPSAKEEDHILQTALLTRPHQSFRELVIILVKKQHTVHITGNAF